MSFVVPVMSALMAFFMRVTLSVMRHVIRTEFHFRRGFAVDIIDREPLAPAGMGGDYLIVICWYSYSHTVSLTAC
jgi:hypothetical protein